jgi:hypothetical protein
MSQVRHLIATLLLLTLNATRLRSHGAMVTSARVPIHVVVRCVVMLPCALLNSHMVTRCVAGGTWAARNTAAGISVQPLIVKGSL